MPSRKRSLTPRTAEKGFQRHTEAERDAIQARLLQMVASKNPAKVQRLLASISQPLTRPTERQIMARWKKGNR